MQKDRRKMVRFNPLELASRLREELRLKKVYDEHSAMRSPVYPEKSVICHFGFNPIDRLEVLLEADRLAKHCWL